MAVRSRLILLSLLASATLAPVVAGVAVGGYHDGSFGIVNTWGLCDMHGNVSVWCLDPWHPSYEGAPKGGSVWLENGDDRYRLLRGGSWGSIPSTHLQLAHDLPISPRPSVYP